MTNIRTLVDQSVRGVSNSGLIRSEIVNISCAGLSASYSICLSVLSTTNPLKAWTYSAHQASGIIPIHCTLSRLPNSPHIALATEKNRVNKSLWLVEVMEKENGDCDETKENGKVVGDKVVTQSHSD